MTTIKYELKGRRIATLKISTRRASRTIANLSNNKRVIVLSVKVG